MRDRRMGQPAQPLSLELVIDPSGRVIQIHILRSVEGYDDAVADAVQKWEYEPTVLRGVPKTVIINTSLSVW
jgi:TonB family protein